MVVGHIEGSLDSEAPLPSKITLVSGLGLGRHERHEIVAVANLLANLLVPCIAAAELAFVVPYFKSKGRERIPDPSRSMTILRGVTQKNGGGYVIGVGTDARHNGTESYSPLIPHLFFAFSGQSAQKLPPSRDRCLAIILAYGTEMGVRPPIESVRIRRLDEASTWKYFD